MLRASPYFFTLEILALAVFLFGLASDVHFWLQGSVGEGGSTSARAKMRLAAAGLGRALRVAILGSILLDWLFQRRLLRSNPLSWLMHVCFFWGMVVLFFVGSVGLFLAEKGLLPIAKDTPWFAFVNDFAGVMVLFGVAVALYRRFVRREWHLKTSLDDAVLIALLALIVISGYLLEGR
ncbi:MAG: respiratory nitrate reductase subunit gamma [Chloroflexi bacterium]|nr:respiratory nitrate reductase subunit gamma [Chloroflexota bacterium]